MNKSILYGFCLIFLMGFLLIPIFSVFAEETKYFTNKTNGVCTDELTVCTENQTVYKQTGTGPCTEDPDSCKPGGGAATQLQLKLTNPLKISSLLELIKAVVDIVWKLGIPVITLAILYCGFLFIQARGKPEDLKKAKTTFFWVVVGAAIILGAGVLAQAIAGTVQRLQASQYNSSNTMVIDSNKW